MPYQKNVQMSRMRPSILDSIKIVILSARFKCLKQALEEINPKTFKDRRSRLATEYYPEC